MGTSTDRHTATRLLHGLEQGDLSATDAGFLARELDPVLTYLIVRYLREVYPATEPAARPVLERVVALTSAWPGIVTVAREGEQDPVSQWFVSQYTFGEFRGRGSELVERIVEKLDS